MAKNRDAPFCFYQGETAPASRFIIKTDFDSKHPGDHQGIALGSLRRPKGPPFSPDLNTLGILILTGFEFLISRGISLRRKRNDFSRKRALGLLAAFFASHSKPRAYGFSASREYGFRDRAGHQPQAKETASCLSRCLPAAQVRSPRCICLGEWNFLTVVFSLTTRRRIGGIRQHRKKID